MHCPHCLYEGNTINGKCARCGYAMKQEPSSSFHVADSRFAPPSQLLNPYTLSRGDILSERYRLLNQITMPEPQQRQGSTWSAIDLHTSQRYVVIREIVVPQAMAKSSSVERLATETAQRLQELGQHEGFPKVIDFFSNQRAYFIVMLYPEGESLATLLKLQNGALPEQMVVEYGYQACGLLSHLLDQQPPIVHGSINPETIIISQDGQLRVSLIHLPLFQTSLPSTNGETASSGYSAPEQVRGELDPSSDLYALAATMHYAITGYDPRERLTFFHPPARRLNPAVTAHMEMILTRQLSLSKSQRYAHPSQMQKDLAALIASYPDSTNTESPTFVVDPLRLSASQLREQVRSVTLLNMGVFAAIGVLLLFGVLFAILRP
jgi:serine/threonine protein kinase